MDDNKGMMGMALGSWIIAAAAGLLGAVLLWLLGDWGFMQGAFVGFVIFLVVGGLIGWIMTRPLPKPGEVQISPATPGAKAPDTKVAQEAAPAPAATATAAPAASVVVASKALPGQSELAQRRGDWKYTDADDAKPAAKKPAAKKTAAKKPAPKKAAAKKAATDSDARPAGFADAPEAGGADDLKKISGVGPKLEETLNSLGIWQYEQVAGLKKKDIAWVDERLRFKGRIERDDWVGQAKKLAKAKG